MVPKGYAQDNLATPNIPDKVRRNSKRSLKQSYSSYINKILKKIHPDIELSKKSTKLMNSFILDVFERNASESSNLAKINGTAVVTTREIQAAVKLILPRELAKRAMSEGFKAIKNYKE